MYKRNPGMLGAVFCEPDYRTKSLKVKPTKKDLCMPKISAKHSVIHQSRKEAHSPQNNQGSSQNDRSQNDQAKTEKAESQHSTKVEIKPTELHEYIVPGLDYLIGNPKIIEPEEGDKLKAEYLLIPTGYVERLTDFNNENSSRGESSRILLSEIWQIRNQINQQGSEYFTCPNGMRIAFMDNDKSIKSSRRQAVDVASQLASKNGLHSVAVMTGSDSLSAITAMSGLDVARVNPEIYRGRQKIVLPDELARLWQVNDSNRFIPDDVAKDLAATPLRLNEYVEFVLPNTYGKDPYFRNIGRYDGHSIIPACYPKFANASYDKIRPLNAGQMMLLDALLAPVDEIAAVIVIGTFGTGKTFLSLVAALSGVESGAYEHITVCPSDSSLGRDIGFVKGDETEKTITKARPIIRSLREVLRLKNDREPARLYEKKPSGKSANKSTKKEKTESLNSHNTAYSMLTRRTTEVATDFIDFIPLINIQGETIARQFLLADEIENTERHQARAIFSRTGKDSKFVGMGDPMQVNNPHLNAHSNGLSYIATHLGGAPLVAVISFENNEVTRSDIAKVAAQYL